MYGSYEDCCCGECRFHRKNNGEWVCCCADSEYYGLETAYRDGCGEGEER